MAMNRKGVRTHAQRMEERFKRDPSYRHQYRTNVLLRRFLIEFEEARKARGLSQVLLARRLKTTQAGVSRILSGHQNLTFETADKLAKAVGKEIKVQLV